MRLPRVLCSFLLARLDRLSKRRAPDLFIGGPENPYLIRWWVIPRNRFFNIYFHDFRRDDDDRALHDHPWWNVSIVLDGGYAEIVPTPGATLSRQVREAGDVVLRRPTAAHRIELIAGMPCRTLFITGPNRRSWGFWCPEGWIHWRDFTSGPAGERVGRGCGEG